MTDIEKWIHDRQRQGTLAEMVNRMYRAKMSTHEAEERLRRYMTLEALMDNGGVQTRAAERLGCHRNHLKKLIDSVGISMKQIRLIAKALRTLKDANESQA